MRGRLDKLSTTQQIAMAAFIVAALVLGFYLKVVIR